MLSLLEAKDLIRQAKEVLGDENAFIMAELLELDDFDEKELKACCPYHREDTPSFIYNKKDLRMHCFAGETKVITKDGTVEISEVINKPVEIINGNGNWEEVVFRDCGKQELMKITLTKNCREKVIYATPEHEWLVRDLKNKVYTKNLKENHRLERMWLKRDKKIIPNIDGLKHGFIYGDGHKGECYKNGKTYYSVALHTEEKLKFCERVFDNVSYPTSTHYAIGNAHFITEKKLKEVPDFNESPEYLMGFIIGYFVADGNCSDGTIQISSAKYEDLVKIRHICTLLGIASYALGQTTRTPKSNMGILKLKENHTMYNLRLVRSTLPDNFFMSDKKPNVDGVYKSYLGYKVKKIEKTNRCEHVYCCETSTHSFVLEDFILTGNCFGCGITVDVVDVLMEKGKTFIDATKWICQKAGIDFTCPEQHVKTLPRYKYPHEESRENDMTKVYEYLESRGISKATVDYLDIRADVNGNIAFHTYDQYDTLTVVNYRKSYKTNEQKCWFQKDADTADLLWNMNRINTTKPLVITEGQLDSASIIEAGYLNCVSVLKGCNSMGWIETCWDWLQQFDSIIIFSDGDVPGVKMRKEVMNRLGAIKCKYVEIPKEVEFKDTGKIVPVKDANEILQARGKEYLLELINSAKDLPITSVAKLSEIKELNPAEMDGFEVGIKQLDEELMKIFTGGVTLLTGLPSAGKTTFLNQVVLHAMDSGYKTFLFSRELLNGMSKGWFSQVAAGRRNMNPVKLKNGNEYHVVNDDAKKQITEYYDDMFYIYKDEEENSEDKLFESMELCATKKGLRLYIIDNLMTVSLRADTTDTNKAQTDFMNRLIRFSMKYDVAVICITHPRKLQSGADIGLNDIAGSQNIVNLATRTIGLKRVKEDDKTNPTHKYFGYDVIISIIKDRIFGSTKDIPVHYDKICRRFFSNYEEFDWIYGWDKKKYYGRLPYPIEKEEFPDK